MTKIAHHADQLERSSMATIFKRAAMLLLLGATLGTLLTHEAYLWRPADPMWTHLAPMTWWLVPHVIGGMLAFVIAPFQFSSTLRRRHKSLHRWLGRVYVCAVLIASTLSVYIVIKFEVQANWWVMGTMGGLWFITTLFDWMAAINRGFIQHQLWIGRSFGLTFTFVLTRIIPIT